MVTKKKLGEREAELAQTYFFKTPGPDNTSKVIRVVKHRLRQGDVRKVLVASETGRLALQLRRAISRTSIACVTYDAATRRKYRKALLMKSELLKAGIVIVDTVQEPLGREMTFRNWWEKKTVKLPGTSADLFWMTLIAVGGHGLRTAVEAMVMALEAGVVRVRERVVSIAGTGWGADSALVMRASRLEDAVGKAPAKRMKIEEILAMPKQTEWTGYG